MAAAFFRGTGIDQNVKFKDKDKQLIRETEWPPEFEKQIDLSKVSGSKLKLFGGYYKMRQLVFTKGSLSKGLRAFFWSLTG